MNDPVKRAEFERKKAEAEAAAKKAEAEAKLASLPKRVKGGAMASSWEGTEGVLRSDKCTAEDPMMSIPCEKCSRKSLDKGQDLRSVQLQGADRGVQGSRWRDALLQG